MAMDLKNKLVIGISSRALFDLEKENKIYEEEGLDAYIKYQVEHEKDILKPGTALPLCFFHRPLSLCKQGRCSGGDRRRYSGRSYLRT